MPEIRATVLKPAPCQLSSYAIACEMLETANRVAQLQGSGTRFKTTTLAFPDAPAAALAADLLILPGLGLATGREIDTALQGPAFDWLMQQLATLPGPNTVVAGACSACFALGAAGLLDGKTVTTTWWLAPLLKDRFPAVRLSQSEIVVQDGRLVTGGAAFAQIDVMLHLIEQFAGFAVAEDCRRFTMSDSRPSQLPYVSAATLVAADPALQQAELHARRHLGQPLAIADLAAAGGMEPRTFARRLQRQAAMTPTVFLQTIRVTEAIRLARSSRLNSDQIAARVGYSDATALRRTMKKRTGRTLESFRS